MQKTKTENTEKLQEYNIEGRDYYDQGNYKDAIKSFENALKINPDHPRANYNIALSYQGQGNHERAIEHYSKVIKSSTVNEDIAKAHYNRGIAFEAVSLHREAISDFNKVLKIKPENIDAHYNLGKSLLALGKFFETQGDVGNAQESHDQAIGAFNGVLKIEPGYIDALLARGDFENVKGFDANGNGINGSEVSSVVSFLTSQANSVVKALSSISTVDKTSLSSYEIKMCLATIKPDSLDFSLKCGESLSLRGEKGDDLSPEEAVLLRQIKFIAKVQKKGEITTKDMPNFKKALSNVETDTSLAKTKTSPLEVKQYDSNGNGAVIEKKSDSTIQLKDALQHEFLTNNNAHIKHVGNREDIEISGDYSNEFDGYIF